MIEKERNGLEIAIIGLAGRFPGAKNVAEYWQNLRAGLETISSFSDEELLSSGVDHEALQDPGYIRRGGSLEEIDLFDAAFFGYSPREAAFLDPQQRLFLEGAEEALEDAGYNSRNYPHPIGVYAGAGLNTYFLRNVYQRQDLWEGNDTFQVITANDKDFLASRVAYKLNLRGPALVVQTACSTSLVAVHLAAQGLIGGECRMALAGGVTIRVPQKEGYQYQEGNILSPDGHCRAFDAQAQGTVAGNGVGIVVLKRLEDAISDHDHIYAIIKGSAINNDGSAKVGYTAPGVQGQVQVVRAAQLTAEVEAASIGYIETHGTGTPVGDPIEIAALTEAFRTQTEQRAFCALGSVKTNIGHLDTASGIAGLIKVIYSLKEQLFLPSLHFQAPNPALHLENSPFYVNTTLRPWETDGRPRRAGVSSFGIGGTNAHIILEEAPPEDTGVRALRPQQLLILSARTESALRQASLNLARHIRQNPELELADIAYTLQVGRPLFPYRQALVCQEREDAARLLETNDPVQLLRGVEEASARPVVMMFPGQGAQYIDMGRGLYRTEEVFRTELDRCADLLQPQLGIDLRSVFYPSAEQEREAAALHLMQTWLTQPALFVVEYALAKQWEAWGVRPAAMIGHSIGEYVAACLAGVFSLEDALYLVAARGRLMQQLPEGAMLAIPLPEQEVQALLTGQLCLAASNTQTQCVVSGPTAEIDTLEQDLKSRALDCRRLRTSHAFHSSMVEPVLDEFVALVSSLKLQPPKLPYISNVTGTWITPEQATDPRYWGAHIRQQVLFARGIAEILREPATVLLEVGPGRTLSTFARAQSTLLPEQSVHTSIPSLRQPKEAGPDDAFLLASLGRLWLAGVPITWNDLHTGELCGRLSLPTYPFERQRYWIDPPRHLALVQHASVSSGNQEEHRSPEEEPAVTFYPRPGLTTSYVAPHSSLEQTLAMIWQQLLGVELIGRYDSFFELGGHSLLATQLASRLRSELQVHLPLRAIFEATTIAELGQLIESSDFARLNEEDFSPPLLPLAREGKLPFSSAQKRFWFMQQMEENASFLNIPLGVRLRGALDIEILHRSLQEIVNRQETLRTTFPLVDDTPEPVIAATLSVALEVEDLRQVPLSEREQAVRQMAAAKVRQPFDLARGPLLRVTLFRLDAEDAVLLCVMHHSISDGWSFGVLLRELMELYVAFQHGQPSPLEDLAIQYIDVVAWQQSWLQGEHFEKQLAYWKEQLGGALPVLDLPADHPRPVLQTYRGAHMPFQFPAALTADLNALSQREDVTIFMLLLAAFQVHCARLSGQEDILIGTPIANRRRTEMEKLIGCFINTLVIRADLSGRLTFRELLQQVRAKTLAAYEHQELPFEQLVEALQPERDLSRSPIFQVMFMLQNVPLPAQQLANLHLSAFAIDAGTAQVDLTCIVTATQEQVTGLIEYNTDLFEESTIRRMVEQWQCLLQAVVANCAQPIAELPLLTPAEQQQLIIWNNSSVDWEEPVCVQQMFAAQVARTPQAVALVWEDTSWTYTELNQAANSIAHSLLKLNVGPGKLVGICLERSAELVIAMLGVLKTGGAYVPLDPAYPQERLSYMLADSQAAVLLTREELRGQFTIPDTLTVVTLPLPVEAGLAYGGGEEDLQIEIPGESLAYVIYTSGSTGKPKGVMISHRALQNCFLSMAQKPGITSGERVLAVTSFSFDIAALELLLPLTVGASIILASQAQTTDALALLRLLDTTCPHFMQATPATWRMLLHAGWTGSPQLKILCGGEALPVGLAQEMCLRADSIWNMYGPTETTIWSTTCQVLSTDAAISIGYPVANTQVYVLDRQGIEVPIGVAGELFIGGDGLARGYWQLPALTAERFVPDPFRNQPGARLYRTGDLVRRLANGSLVYLNRLDFQVKVRGHRIELGEIETRLAQYEGVRSCIVTTHEVGEGDARLIAYLIPQPAALIESHELRRYLLAHLPEYMLPSHFVYQESWPLTPNGKIDRKALPLPDFSAAGTGQPGMPVDAVEEILLKTWAKLLQRDAPGTRENFFDLGGHSLLATQMLAQVRRFFSVEMPLRALFEAPTVAGFAALIKERLRGAPAQPSAALVPVPRERYLPVSFAQQRLWLLEQLESDISAYHIPLSVRIQGPLDLSALERSLGEIVSRHESLRTGFSMQDGEIRQSIIPFTPFSLRFLSLLPLEGKAQQQELQRQMRAEILRPFDLTQPPLLRAKLFQVEEEAYILLLTMHHIIADGPSCTILMTELNQCYTAFSHGDIPSLVPLVIHYADFACWQRQWLRGEVFDTQLAYWKKQLAGITPLELPTDYPRPAVQTFKGADLVFDLPRSLTEALQELCQQEGVTLFMALLAAFQILLYRYTAQEDITVGTPMTNRNHIELEGLIGFFVNTLVLRTHLAANQSFAEILASVRETCLEAYTHQDLPFEHIVDAVQPQRDLSRSPLFQTMLLLQHVAEENPLPDSPLHLSPFPSGSLTAKFDLTLEMTVSGQGMQGRLEYATDLFEAQTMERLVGHWQTLLANLVAHPAEPVASLPLLTATEREQVLREWNTTDTPYPDDLCLHHLFERQVEQRPDALAVLFEQEHLSYAQLNRRANRLAHYLRASGVGPETRVGIYMEPSLETLVALFAILKAGGTYVPIDLAYPQERVAFLLQDAGITILVTQQHQSEKLAVMGLNLQIVALDSASAAFRAHSAANPGWRISPDNLAYILYTSGSTGLPKGVMVSHRGLVNYLSWCSQRYAVAEGFGAPVHSSLNFDLTVTSIFSPLIAGKAVVLLPSERGVEALSNAFRDQQNFSLVKITPAHLALLSQQPDLSSYAASSKLFVIGGEQLLAEKLTFWQKFAPEASFINEYGPTETVVGCCIYEVSPGQQLSGAVPIGRPIANTQIYVLDSFLQPLPPGLPGEIYIGGAGLARGYLKRPELTAERFVPNPFALQAGARLYKTGDLARYRPDGILEYLGRNDDQVKIRSFRVELGEVEAVLTRHPDVRACTVVVREDSPEVKRLVAYVVPRQAAAALQQKQLRDYMRSQLPEYMIPALFVELEQLPLTVNGKVDQRALPDPGESKHEEGTEFIAPRTASERTLAQIWQEVLHIDRVSITDNFFLLGGDSLLSMQIIARAAQAKLRLTPRQVFQHQTIEELASVVNLFAPLQAEQGVVEGPVPLTPVQHWFFEQQLEAAQHWNQSALFQLAEPIDSHILEQAIGTLFLHHDALRLRFTRHEGVWQQSNAGYKEEANYFTCLDLTGLSQTEQESMMAAAEADAQASLDLAQGPLLRAVFFDPGQQAPGRLFLCIHHLVVDNVSWQILIADLQRAYAALLGHEQPQLAAKTTSYKRWAEQLVRYANSEELSQERTFWLEENSVEAKPFPVDFPQSAGENTIATADAVVLSLSQEETSRLQDYGAQVLHTSLNDIILAMVALILTRWMETDALLLDLEGHGREEIADEIDVSQTVGWFTSIYPLALQFPPASHEDEALQSVQRKLRLLPNKGFGYGILRYLHEDPELRRSLEELPQPAVLLNYTGRLDQTSSLNTLFKDILPTGGFERGPANTRKHLFEIICGVNKGQLYIDWRYSKHVHHQSTIEQLATDVLQVLRALPVQSHTQTNGSIPADLFQVNLSPGERTQIFAELQDSEAALESITNLSPVQQGMLYETLSAPGTGIHIEQWLCTLTGNLDREALRRAWQWELDRHPIFRTSFLWNGIAEPVQVTYHSVTVPFLEYDLKMLAPAEQATFMERFLEEERTRGFDLSSAPLIRLSLFCLAPDTYRLVLTYHHMLMDLWCHHLVMREVFACYQAYCNQQELHLEPSFPYTEYVAWLNQQNLSSAERFWRATLSGFTRSTALGRIGEPGNVPEGIEIYASELLKLPTSETARLQHIARQQRVTLNTLFQGVWALLLSRYSTTDDVLFGITVAGRPPELPGIESMVGVCINALPLRIRLPADTEVWPWLSAIQGDNLDLRQYEYTPAGLIHSWSDVSDGEPFYESLLVVENFPESFSAFDATPGEITLSQPQLKGAQTRYPLTLLLEVRQELGIGCIYDRRRFSQSMIQLLLGHFRLLLEHLGEGMYTSLDHFRQLIPVEHIPVVFPAPGKHNQYADPPRTPLEHRLATIWQEVLRIERVGIHANFLELGGHSLLATQLISRIRTEFQLEIPLHSLFAAPTIATFAEQLTQLIGQTPLAEAVPLVPVLRDRALPLSLAQQRLWFLDQLLPNSSVYTITRALQIQGNLNRTALRQSMEEIIRRHEVLRTTFSSLEDQPVQIIHSQVKLSWSEIDLQHVVPEKRETQALVLVQAESQKPIDLTQGPLVRILLLTLDPENALLALSVHHIVFDIWSEGVLVRELMALYPAFAAGQPSPLAELPVQYADFAVWQRQWLRDTVLNRQISYWQQQLQNASVLELPTDYPRKVTQSARGAMQTFAFDQVLSKKLLDLSRKEGVTLFMTLLTGFMTLLSRYTGQTDIVVGTDIANRTHTETEDLIGFFVNLLVLRGDLSGNPRFSHLLQQISKMLLDAYAHQDLPFEKLIEALRLERKGAQTPLVRALFVLQNAPWVALDLEGITITPLQVEQDMARFELAFFLWETPEGLHGMVNYSTDLFTELTMSNMITHFETLLQSICSQTAAHLDALSMYSEEEEKARRASQLGKLRKRKRQEV